MNRVVHMCVQRNAKKGLFFETTRDSHKIAIRVKILPIFEKRGLLGSIKGRLGVIFQTLPNMFSKKSLLRGKFGGKIARNSRLGGVFHGEGKSRVCFENLWSRMCINTSIQVPPPP